MQRNASEMMERETCSLIGFYRIQGTLDHGEDGGLLSVGGRKDEHEVDCLPFELKAS